MGYSKEFDQDLLISMLIHEPLSEQEQHGLLNSFKQRAFLDGVDKGTELERKITKERNEKVVKKYYKELSAIVDDINDKISEFNIKNKYK